MFVLFVAPDIFCAYKVICPNYVPIHIVVDIVGIETGFYSLLTTHTHLQDGRRT